MILAFLKVKMSVFQFPIIQSFLIACGIITLIANKTLAQDKSICSTYPKQVYPTYEGGSVSL